MKLIYIITGILATVALTTAKNTFRPWKAGIGPSLDPPNFDHPLPIPEGGLRGGLGSGFESVEAKKEKEAFLREDAEIMRARRLDMRLQRAKAGISE
ncbi:uncharacterized protein H6S33_008861 [Morchella sextelata]|uniref:uncharacterized protein n=1 Tax=Morchella sextelata TaxID=1174677 RepID=UPI001D03E81D|nr:uncharacterized protein H6S33_008861 [Morchella sextelata]KAH0612481.1 hypothetical protein H6S33_008861 [Morchella sextelata]